MKNHTANGKMDFFHIDIATQNLRAVLGVCGSDCDREEGQAPCIYYELTQRSCEMVEAIPRFVKKDGSGPPAVPSACPLRGKQTRH